MPGRERAFETPEIMRIARLTSELVIPTRDRGTAAKQRALLRTIESLLKDLEAEGSSRITRVNIPPTNAREMLPTFISRRDREPELAPEPTTLTSMLYLSPEFRVQ